MPYYRPPLQASTANLIKRYAVDIAPWILPEDKYWILTIRHGVMPVSKL